MPPNVRENWQEKIKTMVKIMMLIKQEKIIRSNVKKNPGLEDNKTMLYSVTKIINILGRCENIFRIFLPPFFFFLIKEAFSNCVSHRRSYALTKEVLLE